MLHGKTSPFLILFPYSRLARGGVGGGRWQAAKEGVDGTWELRTEAAPGPRCVALRGSWSARPRAFPVRISFKYEVDFIFPRCN